ncbi:MAG: GntR family transcriptional regulator [Flavobacteriales bacterium]|nr:GntR family transcriptional regulator [Flavobacteriales bacterium]
MIHTGRIQDLVILRHTSAGLILGDAENEEVLLPNTARPTDDTLGSTLRVFIYRDRDDRQFATTRLPKVQAGEFARLRVQSTTAAGAWVDMGTEVELFVPEEEQKKPLDEGRWYVMRLAVDERRDRPFGSTRIDEFLDNTDLTVQHGDKVDLLVFGRSDLGFSVIVNNIHQGLVHAEDVFKPVSVGDRLTGYVKQVRPDNKLDITFQAIGYRQFNDENATLLAKRLQSRNGFLPLTDKSSAEAIYEEFGISKKAFKKALGALYKERKVRIEEDGIMWIA